MAVAAPTRRTAPAPAPSRTTPPPKPKAPPRRRAAAPAKAPARRPARKQAPAVGPRLVVVAGRTAGAVSQLPDSGLIVRMTRGRAWIGVLAVLLVGIVGLNVATLSFGSAYSKVDAQIVALEKENSMLGSRAAQRSSTERVRGEAAVLGLTMPHTEEPKLIEADRADVAAAAARLAAAGG